MSLPDFELGPLEMEEVDASEPAVAPATARVKVGNDWFLLRICLKLGGMPTVFFRLDEHGAPVLLATPQFVGNTKELLEFFDTEEEKHPLVDWKLFLEKLILQEEWQRVLAIENVLEMPITSARLETSQWLVEGKKAPFIWSRATRLPPSWLLRASNDMVNEEVRRWLASPKNDGGFALRWATLKPEQEIRFVSQFRQGNWNELEEMLKLIVWNHADFCGNYSVGEWWFYLDFDLREQDSQRISWNRSEYQNSYELSLDEHDIPSNHLPKVLARWIEIIDAYYDPSCKSNLNGFLLVERILRGGRFCHIIEFSAPTQHERLEARLRLREWLIDKVAPDEIPALLGEA